MDLLEKRAKKIQEKLNNEFGSLFVEKYLYVFVDLFCCFDPFILKFEAIESTTISLPIKNNDTIVIDWGDGEINNEIKHIYNCNFGDIFEIKIYGDFECFDCCQFYSTNQDRFINNFYNITKIIQYGSNNLLKKINFFGCVNLISVPTYLPSSAIDLSYMFYSCGKFNEKLIFDTSNIIDMSSMFSYATNFSQSLETFKTHNVEHMDMMFYKAFNFRYSVSHFDFSKATLYCFMSDV